MVKKVAFIIFLSIGLVGHGSGQTVDSTESMKHVFWQRDRQLTEDDFQGSGYDHPKYIKYCNENNLCTMAFVGVFAVLDVPKKIKKRDELTEKVYFAPALDKEASYILNDDTAGIGKQKLIFDIYELSTRFARRELNHFQDSLPGYGILTIMFKTVESQAVAMRENLVDSYTKDLFIDNVEGAYETWRSRVDQWLVDTEEYATKPEDCYRFVKNEPIEAGYVKAKKVVGPLGKGQD